MKVCFVHSGIIPPKTYGGTERILYWLIKELGKIGVQVYLIGHPLSDLSRIGGTLIPWTGGEWLELVPKDTDLLHLFLTPSAEVLKRFPTLVTIHGNGKAGEEFIANTVFLSRIHAENHGASHFVYNGIDFDDYPFDPKKKLNHENYLFLAKASWKVKNLGHCIRACRKTKRHLHIAGGRSWLPSGFIHNYGMIGQQTKLDLLRKMDGLLFPVRWHEPFGVAVIEAMSQGVPVYASCYGSLPELVGQGTGVILHSYDELVSALLANHTFDPTYIRQYAEENFSSQVMASNYYRYYQRVIAGEVLHSNPPISRCKNSAEILLDF